MPSSYGRNDAREQLVMGSYWTSTPGRSQDHMWGFDSGSGKLEDDYSKSTPYFVRWVKAIDRAEASKAIQAVQKRKDVALALDRSVPKPIATGICADNPDGTVTGVDGSIWQRCVIGEKWNGQKCEGSAQSVSWSRAIHLATADRFLGHSDWMLPTASLFQKSLHHTSCKHPAIRMHVKSKSVYVRMENIELAAGSFWTSEFGAAGAVFASSSYYEGFGVDKYYNSNRHQSPRGEEVPIYAAFVRLVTPDVRASFAAAQTNHPNLVKVGAEQYDQHLRQKYQENERNRATAREGPVNDKKIAFKSKKPDEVDVYCDGSFIGTLFRDRSTGFWKGNLFTAVFEETLMDAARVLGRGSYSYRD